MAKTVDHFALWGSRLVAVSFLDLVLRHGQLTTEIDARVLYEKSKALRDASLADDDGSARQQFTPPPEPTIFGLPIFKLSTLEAKFITESAFAVTQFLGAMACEPRRHSNHIVFKRRTASPSPSFWSAAELAAMHDDVCASFDGPQSFEYRSIVEPLVRANAACVAALIGDVFPPDVKLPPNVTVIPNVPIGGCMIPFDMCFETDPANCRVSFPDYNVLSDTHRDHFFALPELAPFRGRRHFHYLLKCVAVPSHEIIHVFQGVAKQRDPTPHGWSAEHDASVPAGSLLYHVAQVAKAVVEGRIEEPPTIGESGEGEGPEVELATRQLWRDIHAILGNGVVEAAMIDLLRELRDIQALLTPEEMGEFIKIKDAFGTYQPQLGAPLIALAFKALLPYEYFTATPRGLETLLRLCFQDRLGVNTSLPETKPLVPPECTQQSRRLFQRPAEVDDVRDALNAFAPV